jgi:hypothetical protein
MLSTIFTAALLGAGLPEHKVHGKYLGTGLAGPETMELWSDGKAKVAAKPGTTVTPATWHPRAGTLVWKGGQATWSVISPDALALILPDGLAVAFRVAKFGPRGASLPETRGKAGFFELFTNYTADIRKRPAKLFVSAEGTFELCAQLGPQVELEPACYSGKMQVIAGELVTAKERIPFTMTENGDVALATGITLGAGEYQLFRRDPQGTVP